MRDIGGLGSLLFKRCPILKVAHEHLLSEVVVFMNRESLEACSGIAAHPIFSKVVKKSVASGGLFKGITIRRLQG